MQALFVLLLIAVLAVSVLVFLAMGLSQRRRKRQLARQAHRAGMRFYSDDPFDLPRRYAGFAVMSAGHSHQASNITQGRLDIMPIRAFDLRYEVGHGTRRTTRHYTVVAADVPEAAPSAIAWHMDDLAAAPLLVAATGHRRGSWRCIGDLESLEILTAACAGLASNPVSIQCSGKSLLICIPVDRDRNRSREDLDAILESVAKCGEALCRPTTLTARNGEGIEKILPTC